MRSRPNRIGGLDDVLREYSITSDEGLALMVMAETLLRVPDDATADRLIADKLATCDWQAGAAVPPLVTASAWALGLGARVLKAGESETLLAGLSHRIGAGAVRRAARQAMKVLGGHFVHARSIDEALRKAASREGLGNRYSFDMLGEGARTAEDAARYTKAYADAIEAIGRTVAGKTNTARETKTRLGISIKLSALHPRFEAQHRATVTDIVLPRVADLARVAKGFDIAFTIDAEEADRLELSLDLVDALLADPTLADWGRFWFGDPGLFQTSAGRSRSRMRHGTATSPPHHGAVGQGAYWDTEIKRAQERGLPDYPVFTRKAMTDMNYVACARKMLAARDCLYPQFATHNALTIATLVSEAGGVQDYEFQRLHGMGEGLYAALRATYPDAACRIYAPVGTTETLLAYLVRRLLENGANSSFVTRSAMSRWGSKPCCDGRSPWSATRTTPALPGFPCPAICMATNVGWRPGSTSASRHACRADWFHRSDCLFRGAASSHGDRRRRPFAEDRESRLAALERTRAGPIAPAVSSAARTVSKGTRRAFSPCCNARRVRRSRMRSASGARESISAAITRLRRGRRDATILPGPTGEENCYIRAGRGVFIAISPWNFPLSIFLGQVAAALVTGNAVIAKPAAQTPLVA